MALGGAAGIPMIAAFCWLAACYTVFAMGALRPALVHRAAWTGFLGIALGDLLLAFPTDAPGRGTTLARDPAPGGHPGGHASRPSWRRPA